MPQSVANDFHSPDRNVGASTLSFRCINPSDVGLSQGDSLRKGDHMGYRVGDPTPVRGDSSAKPS